MKLQIYAHAHFSQPTMNNFSYAWDDDVFVNLSKNLKVGKRGEILWPDDNNKKENQIQIWVYDSLPDRDSVLNLLDVIANDLVFDVVQHANSQKNPKNLRALGNVSTSGIVEFLTY